MVEDWRDLRGFGSGRASVAAALPVFTAAPAWAGRRGEGDARKKSEKGAIWRRLADKSSPSTPEGNEAPSRPLALLDDLKELVVHHHAVAVHVHLRSGGGGGRSRVAQALTRMRRQHAKPGNDGQDAVSARPRQTGVTPKLSRTRPAPQRDAPSRGSTEAPEDWLRARSS